jgi:hypothetical protein
MTTLLEAAKGAIHALRRIDQWLKVRSGGTGLMPIEQKALDDLEQAIAQEQAVLEPESCSTCGNNEAPFAKCDVCTVQYDSDEVSNWEPNP